MSAHNDVPAIRRRRRQLPLQFFGAGLDFLSQTGGKSTPRLELSFQAGRQPIAFGETRRQVVVAAFLPLTGCVAIMVAVSATVMIPILVPVIIVVAIVFVVTLAVSLSLARLG